MDSQEFAQDYAEISYATALRIAAKHGLDDEFADEILLGREIDHRIDGAGHTVDTASLLLWLGY